jgi:hypothetical protein
MVPAMVTSPVARRVAGVLLAFRVTVTVTPAGIVMVVKLKTSLGGRASVVLLVGLKGPSTPVLPLVNPCASARVRLVRRVRRTPKRTPIYRAGLFIVGAPLLTGSP